MSVLFDGCMAVAMDLAEFLQAEVDQTSLRAVAAKTRVSKTAIENIIKRQTTEQHKIGTLERIALAYGKELYEVMQMAGVKLGLPQNDSERSRRLAALVARKPALERLIERLSEKIDTNPGYVDGMIIGLEASLDQRDPSS